MHSLEYLVSLILGFIIMFPNHDHIQIVCIM